MAAGGQRIIRVVAFGNICRVLDALMRFDSLVKFVVVKNSQNIS